MPKADKRNLGKYLPLRPPPIRSNGGPPAQEVSRVLKVGDNREEAVTALPETSLDTRVQDTDAALPLHVNGYSIADDGKTKTKLRFEHIIESAPVRKPYNKSERQRERRAGAALQRDSTSDRGYSIMHMVIIGSIHAEWGRSHNNRKVPKEILTRKFNERVKFGKERTESAISSIISRTPWLKQMRASYTD